MYALDLSNVKAEKGSTAMPRYNIFGGIAKTLRIIELCLALFFLSWILTRLPFALRLSAHYLRSPLFVFAISNAIIAALFAQFRRFPADEPDSAAPVTEAIRDTYSCTDDDSPALQNVHRRSDSEKLKERNETVREELRRSETERENFYPQDKLSNEEFRRTIEAFIAKQTRLLREESLAIFVQTSEPTLRISN
ncbi:uncharacterized protein LOC113870294 [Abrus precatorius]|uniref:Uncharacterized protein LOC113870294 n=1 Tax=Abrus precatorius TaxID=3816 RepID=A0A8B8M1Z0_ABRPR|nr:uncharacterized protein LOC113870294 [Abrus precatorius]